MNTALGWIRGTVRTPLRRLRGTDPERGSVTIWFATSSLVMVTLIGLAVDLTGQVHAQQRTRDVAAQAARAGGQQVDTVVAMRGDGAQVNPAAAVHAAQSYLAAAGVTGSVTLQGGDLVVHTSDTYQTKFLSIVGIGAMPVTGQASVRVARTVAGVEK